MTKKSVVNLIHIQKVNIYDKSTTWAYEYRPYKKRIFLKDREEGYYFWHSDYRNERLTKKQLEETVYKNRGFVVEGNAVYWCPQVVLEFNDGKKEHKNFRTYEDALEWGHDVIRKSMRIKAEVD